MMYAENLFLILDGYGFLCQNYQFYIDRVDHAGKTNPIRTGLLYKALETLRDHKFGHRYLNDFGRNIYKACVIDTNFPTYRDSWTKNLTKTNDALFIESLKQYPAIEKLSEINGWISVRLQNERAIDVIKALTVVGLSVPNTHVVIFSDNKDVYQLLDDNVGLVDQSMYRISNGAEVAYRNKITSSALMLDFVALNSVNSNGKRLIPKITTAICTKLINQYGSIEKILSNVSNIKAPFGDLIAAVGQDLIDIRNSMLVSESFDQRKLAPSLLVLDTFAEQEVDKVELRGFYDQFGFRRERDLLDKEIAKDVLKGPNVITPRRVLSTRASEFYNDLVKNHPQLQPLEKSNNLSFSVYRIENKITRRIYFGSTNNPHRRWKEHIADLDFGRHGNLQLAKDVYENGFDSLEFKILKRFHLEVEMRNFEQLLIIMYWGRGKCYNRETDVDNADKVSHSVITAVHKSFKDKKETRGCSALIKGYGNFLSIHAAARELNLNKVDIQNALVTPGQSVNGWSFGAIR